MSMNNIGEYGSFIYDEKMMCFEFLNLIQLAYVAKMLNDVKLVLLVSWYIEYEWIDLYDLYVMLLVVSLKSSQVLSVIRGRMVF